MKTQTTDTHPARVLVIRAGALGDTAYASSIIEPLRYSYGKDIIIDWIATTGIGSVFDADPRVNQIFEFKSRRLPFFFNKDKWKIVAASWSNPYDIIINLELGSIFDTTMRLMKGAIKIGSPYDHFEEPEGNHAVENLHVIYKSFMNDSAIELAEPCLQGTSSKKIREKFTLNSEYLVLVPSNSHYKASPESNYRAWPIEYWRELIQRLANGARQVIIIGSKSEEHFFTLFHPLPDNVISLVGKTNIPDLIGLISGASAVITTDTGPSHIAGATNTPVYAIIGPTDFRRTGPFQTKHNRIQIISAHLPCSPCYNTARISECKKNRCMYEVLPNQVLAALNGE